MQLRFAFSCCNNYLRTWQVDCIKKIIAAGNTELVFYTNLPRKSKTKFSLKNALYHFYWKFFIRLKSLKKISVQDAFKNIHPYTTGNNIPDFILHFDDAPLPLKDFTPEFGIWNSGTDPEHSHYSSSPAFWQVFRNDASTGVALNVQIENNFWVYKKGFFKTTLHSVEKNLETLFNTYSSLVAEAVQEIARGVFRKKEKETVALEHNRELALPGNFEMILFFLRLILNKLKKNFRNLFLIEKWNIGIVDAPIHSFLDKNFNPEIKWMKEPPGNDFYADPFCIKTNAGWKMFFENFDAKKKEGIISVADPFSDSAIKLETALETGIHLSYPFLFEEKGIVYCIPETCQDNEVALYHVIENRLVKDSTLIKNFAGIDNTVIYFQNKWWMFSTDKTGPDLRLFIFYSGSLKGAWEPHILNPVKTDISSARPGGTPFIYEGILYRPSQDSSKTYGGRVVLNKINKLTKTEFDEEVAGYAEPAKNSIYKHGFHTLSGYANMTVVDGKRFRFTLKKFLNFLTW